MEVVINKCFGGFSISRAAFHRLRALGCAAALAEPDIGECYPGTTTVRDGKFAADSFGREIPRNDPLLAQVVREMGARANGEFASLAIVDVPDDAGWEISDYDGKEHVAEKHRTWG